MHRSADALRQSPRTNGTYEGRPVVVRPCIVGREQTAGDPDSTLKFDRGTVFLLREMTHRINNEFASLMGLMSRAARDLTDDRAKAAFEDVAECLCSHAEVHRALAVPEHDDLIDATDYLGSLCRAISRTTLARRGITLTMVGTRQYATAAQCWKLGMIVSELVNNSVRHAFAEGGSRIRVDLGSAGHQLRCRVSDDGKHSTQYRPPSRRSGLTIVETLATAMAGTIEHRATAQGTRAVIRFPATHRDPSLAAFD